MDDHQSERPQTPSGAGSAVIGLMTPEHTDTQVDLVMTDYDVPGTSTEHSDVFFDKGEASTEGVLPTDSLLTSILNVLLVQNEEGATRSVVMPAENQAALMQIELLLHKKEVENIAARVKTGNITQLELVNALEAVAEGLLGMAVKHDAGSESAR